MPFLELFPRSLAQGNEIDRKQGGIMELQYFLLGAMFTFVVLVCIIVSVPMLMSEWTGRWLSRSAQCAEARRAAWEAAHVVFHKVMREGGPNGS